MCINNQEAVLFWEIHPEERVTHRALSKDAHQGVFYVKVMGSQCFMGQGQAASLTAYAFAPTGLGG